MKTKYYASKWESRITKVLVENETAAYVFHDKRRVAKFTDDACYADTYEEAVEFLMTLAEQAQERARYDLQRAKDRISVIKGLKKRQET